MRKSFQETKTTEVNRVIGRWTVLVWAGALGLLPLDAFAQRVRGQVAGPKAGDPQQTPSVTSLPVDRQMARWIRQGEEALQARNWPVLIERAQRVIEAQSDSLVPVAEDKHVSARQAALKLLQDMPREGRDLYEAQYEALARRQLAEAKQARDLVLMGRIALRYPLTTSGWEAAEYLGTALLEEGKLALACRVLQGLVEHPDFATRGHPQILLKLAAAQAGTGDRALAEKTLEELLAKYPGTALATGGDRTTSKQFLAALAPLAQRSAISAVSDWSAFLGGSKRNLLADGSAPLLLPDWSVPITRSGRFDAARWEGYLRARQRYSVRRVPGPYPLAQDGRLFVKTLDGLVALDMESGKLLWRAAPWSGGSASYVAKILSVQSYDPSMQQMAGGFYESLLQTLFEDTIEFAMAAGDGCVFTVDRVFPVFDPETTTAEGQAQIVFGFPGQPVQPRDNALAAYDAATGKLLWRVSGHAGLPKNREEYFGLFFLGAPLAFDGQLLVLGDRAGESCFLTIDARTGAKLSEVSLCVATRPANQVVHRQQDACPISVADGIAFCPTQYGRLFAVDLISRRILWNFEYPHTLTNPNQGANVYYVDPAMVAVRPEVSAPIVAGHLVVFLPSDGNQLFALNRATGKQVWQSPVEKSNFLVAVHEGKVLAAGETMAAFDLETGRQLWKTQPGVPVGRGVALGDKYLVPVPGKRLVEVSLKDGARRDCARVPVASSPAAVQSAGIALPDDWKFSLLKFEGEEWTRFDFEDQSWRSVTVQPGGWDALGYRNYRGTAHYRLKFRCPAVPDGKRLVLQCDGIRGQAVFAVNGQQVGGHQAGPGQAVLLDITEPAKPETENVLAVCVQTLTESGGLTVQPSLCFRRASTELRELGNLIVCRDTLVSASGDGVEAFPMAATALRSLEESFRREGGTAKNLLRRAKVSLCQGKPDEAIKDLRKARELEADDLLKESLRAALVQALMDVDKASKDKERTYLFEAKALAANGEERRLVLERLMGHYQDSGQIPEAVKTAMEMAELVSDGMVDADDGLELRTRADRWLAGRILDVWRSAGKDHVERLASEFKAETDKLSLEDEKAVRNFLKVYGELPASAPLWLKLAGKLAQGDRAHEAESIYLRFIKDERPEVAASALWGMAQLSHLLGVDEDADYFVRVLQARHGQVALPDGQTVAAATEQLRKELRLAGPGGLSRALLPVKKVEIATSNATPYFHHWPLMTDGAWLPSYRTTLFTNSQGAAIRVLSARGDWDVPLPPQQYQQPWQMFGVQRIMTFSGYHAQSVFAVGHQAYLAMNMQLFAALPVKRRVLWRRSMESDWRAGAGPLTGGGQWSYAHYQPGGIIRVQRGHYGMYQQRYCMLLGATPRCLLFYDTNELAALDPVANELVWRRALNCPEGTEILLSENHLYEIPPDGKLRAYRLSDGRKVGDKDTGNLRSRPGLYYQGRYISAATSGADAEFSCVDPFTDKAAWTASLPAQANYFRLNDGELGVFQANGTLSLISLDSGLKTFEAKAPELGGVPNSMIYGWSTPSLMFIIVPQGRTQGASLHNLANARYVQQRGNQFGVVGDLHCFDARAGKFLWKRSISDGRMMFCSAGPESPVVPLIKQINKQVKDGQQTRWVQGFELEVVEAATGRLLGQHKAEEGGHVYQMMEEKDAVILRTTTGTVAIRYQVDTSGAPAKEGAPLPPPADGTKEK